MVFPSAPLSPSALQCHFDHMVIRAGRQFQRRWSTLLRMLSVRSCVYDLTVNGHYNFHFDEALGAHLPPWVVSQPTNQIVHVGSNAVFTVKVGGILQDGEWTSDNSIPPRYYGNNFTLVKSDVQRADIGHYFYIAENVYGSVTSAPASLVVYTDATPNLSIDLGSTNSGFQFDISGVTGLNYSVRPPPI